MDRDGEIRPIRDVEEGAAAAVGRNGENKGTAHRHTWSHRCIFHGVLHATPVFRVRAPCYMVRVLIAPSRDRLSRARLAAAFFTLIAEVKRTLGELENKVGARTAVGESTYIRACSPARLLPSQVGPTAEEIRALGAGQAHAQLDEPRSLAVIFEDQLTFDEQKKRGEIEERSSEIQMLHKQAKLKLQEIDADAKVRPHTDRSVSSRAANRLCDCIAAVARQDVKKKYSVADRKMRTNMHTTLAKRTVRPAAIRFSACVIVDAVRCKISASWFARRSPRR
jgi:hypothetical protein